MIYAHLVPDQSSHDDERHVLDGECWCEPSQCNGEWSDRPAVLVDHRQAPDEDGPHAVFLVEEDGDDQEPETMTDGVTGQEISGGRLYLTPVRDR